MMSALPYELRAATGLAQLLQRQSRAREGHELLGEVYGRFRDGFELRDLVAAKATLDPCLMSSVLARRRGRTSEQRRDRGHAARGRPARHARAPHKRVGPGAARGDRLGERAPARSIVATASPLDESTGRGR